MGQLNINSKGPRRPKWLFAFWAAYCECNLFLEFLKLFVVVDMDGSFPMNHSMQHAVHELERF
jgi:Zn-dependent protease